MVIEDAGNISHSFRTYVIPLGLAIPGLPGQRIIAYAIYGLVALYPIFIYFKHKLSFPLPFKFIVIVQLYC